MPRRLLWPFFALVMGFFVGGSLVWGVLYKPPNHTGHYQEANNSTAQKEHKEGFWEKATDDPVAFFTLCLVGFTAVLAVSTVGLWTATISLYRGGERQLEFLRESSEGQSRDMQASVAASTAAVEIANKNFLAEHGTWLKVYPTEIGPITISKDTIRLEVTIETENVGRNPAISVHIDCSMYRAEGGMGIGEPELRNHLEQAMAFASLAGMQRDLLLGEKATVTFTSDAKRVPRLEELAKRYNRTGSAITLGIAFSAHWKTTVSDNWRHSSAAIIITPKGDARTLDIAEGVISKEELSFLLIPGKSHMSS